MVEHELEDLFTSEVGGDIDRLSIKEFSVPKRTGVVSCIESNIRTEESLVIDEGEK